MASLPQKSANLKNSAASTGPVTPEGKAKMRDNPRTHGLTSRHLIVGDESTQDFEELLQRLVHDHNPNGEQQVILVQQIAENYWRLLRARRVETDTINRHSAQIAHEQSSKEFLVHHKLAKEGISRLDRIAATFARHGAELDRLRRYETAIERAYYRAVNALIKLQAVRKKEETSKIGSVSKNPAQPVQASAGGEAPSPAPSPAPSGEPLHGPASHRVFQHAGQ